MHVVSRGASHIFSYAGRDHVNSPELCSNKTMKEMAKFQTNILLFTKHLNGNIKGRCTANTDSIV